MLHWSLLIIPAVTAIVHRFNGEDIVRKPIYLIMMTALIAFALGDIVATIMFLLVLVAIAVPPTHSLFSAGHGRKPGRKDNYRWQWMQDIAFRIIADEKANPPEIATNAQWIAFGVIYGAIRGLLTLAGIAALCGYTGSWVPLTGIVFMLQGAVYYAAGVLQRHYNIAEGMFVVIAEVLIGWMIGTYLLIVAAAL